MSSKISRREVLKGTGALVVSFNLFGPVSKALAQLSAGPDLAGDLQATSLDSWIAIGRDGIVTVFSSKVDLGTGVETALGQIVADELDVQFKQIKMITGDNIETARAIGQDQAIAFKVLTLANSAVYTRGTPVDSVHTAVVRIGIGRIRQAILNYKGVDIGTLLSTDVSNQAPGNVGHVVSVKFSGTGGSVEVPADVFLRTYLGLKSTMVRLSPF